ncbi:hypothetical protein D3C71_1700300 [compost metagenome]
MVASNSATPSSGNCARPNWAPSHRPPNQAPLALPRLKAAWLRVAARPAESPACSTSSSCSGEEIAKLAMPQHSSRVMVAGVVSMKANRPSRARALQPMASGTA